MSTPRTNNAEDTGAPPFIVPMAEIRSSSARVSMPCANVVVSQCHQLPHHATKPNPHRAGSTPTI